MPGEVIGLFVPLATNLIKAGPTQEFHDMNVRQFKIIDTSSPRVAVVSITDPSRRG